MRGHPACPAAGSAGAAPAAVSRWRCFYGLSAALPGERHRRAQGLGDPVQMETQFPPGENHPLPASVEIPHGVSAQELPCAQGSLLSMQARECEPSQTCGPTHGWPAGAKAITWDLCLGSVKVPGIIRKAVK